MWSSYLTYSFCMVSIVLPFLFLLLYLWFLVLHWIKMERVGVLFLTLVLGEMLSVFFSFQINLAADFLYTVFIVLKYIPSSSVLSRDFIRKGYWILITVFFISIYLIMWFFNVKPICVSLVYLWYLYRTFEFTNVRSSYLLFYIKGILIFHPCIITLFIQIVCLPQGIIYWLLVLMMYYTNLTKWEEGCNHSGLGKSYCIVRRKLSSTKI